MPQVHMSVIEIPDRRIASKAWSAPLDSAISWAVGVERRSAIVACGTFVRLQRRPIVSASPERSSARASSPSPCQADVRSIREFARFTRFTVNRPFVCDESLDRPLGVVAALTPSLGQLLALVNGFHGSELTSIRTRIHQRVVAAQCSSPLTRRHLLLNELEASGGGVGSKHPI
jgi:hypothetical protein